MYLLDTDTLTHLHAGHPKVVERLQSQTGSQVGTTIVSRLEILRGRIDAVFKAAASAEFLKAQSLLAKSEQLLSELLTVPLDAEALAIFERQRFTKGLKKIGRADLLIASICLAHQATLVTRNNRHFRQVPLLKLANWVD
jgi:tRNA(fMet)-specific endonuclease VapC